MFDAPRARLGIITACKAYLDVRQALDDLGLGERAAAALGIRLYKVGLTWPLEVQSALGFAAGLEDVLVVEEKRGFTEDPLVRVLSNLDQARRPIVVGRRDEHGAALLPSHGEITPALLANAIFSRLARRRRNATATARNTCSRTWATAPISTAACSPFARPR